MNPTQLLRDGAALLAPCLDAAGFRFVERETGVGSGGPFAVGEFQKEHRTLELHVRSALGIVVYRAAGVTILHEALMRGVAANERPSYPGFSEDPLDGFRHLRADLDRFGDSFLRGSDQDFAEAAARGDALSASRRGFRSLS